MKVQRLTAKEIPPIPEGSTLWSAIESAFRFWKPVLPVSDKDGRIVGLFNIFRLLEDVRTKGLPPDPAPLGPYLETEFDSVLPGAEGQWTPTEFQHSAVLTERDNRYAGMLYSLNGHGEKYPPPLVNECMFHIASEMCENAAFMVVVADGEGKVLHANNRIRNQFPDHFLGKTLRVGDLFPPITWNKEGPPGIGQSPRLVEKSGRMYLVFEVTIQESQGGKLSVIIAHEIDSILTEDQAHAHEDLGLLTRVLDLSVDGLQVVNRDGIITMVNRSYEEIHGIPRSEAVGKHVTQVIDNTRMHIVAQTGIAELDEIQKIGERRFVVSRIPIYQAGKCVGAVGKIVFQDFNEVNRLVAKIENLKKQLEMIRQGKELPGLSDTKWDFDDIIANSPNSIWAKENALRIAPTETTVLLLGESGVGKEVFAHAIHNMSIRSGHPFVRVNCSAIQETLFEAELFGYEEGAFTGARKGGKPGKFEMANHGTIFLDEIGDMPLNVQAKLLRVLQEREIDKVGGEALTKVDVRVIAATNQNLWRLVEEGKFRKDLFYRLNVIPISIPPLRDRREDIPELVRIFWEELKKKHGIYHKSLSLEALEILSRHDWPGNIRELRNVLERALAIILEETISGEQIRMIMVGARESKPEWSQTKDLSLEDMVSQTERRAISFALARTNNNRAQAAKMLNISRALLYKKMGQYGMS